jgi:hypothetical protein
VSVYAPKISAALAASINTDKLAETWLALNPGLSKGIPPVVTAGITDAISRALQGVLGDLWPEGWVLGQKSAEAASAGVADVNWGTWTPGDPAAAREIAGPGLRRLLGEQGIRIKSIAQNRLEELSQILEDTLSSNAVHREPGTEPLPPFLSVQDLASRLKGVLDNPDRAELVAQAEIARAQATAARTVYAETGRTEVEISTAEDDKVCPVCDAAEKLGAHPLGRPPLVPLHPRCRCAELPVIGGYAEGPVKLPPELTPDAPAATPAEVPAPPAARVPRQRVTSAAGTLQESLDTAQRKELKAQTAAAGKAMTPAQRKVIDQWTGTNGMVRRIQTGKVAEKTATAFNDAMQSAPKVDGLVYRGVAPDSHLADLVRRLKPGQELELGEPVSTSIDPKQSAGFGTILFEIDSPAASFIAGIGKLYEYEQEAVLAPGRFRVVSIEDGVVSLNRKTPVKIIRLEDVTQGSRTWLPTSGSDLAAAKAAEEDDDRSERFVQGDGPGEFRLAEDS